MRKPTSIAVAEWSVEPSGPCGDPVAVVQGSEGSELRLEVTEDEAHWLIRGRHPAYASRLRPMLDALAERALWLQLDTSPSGGPVATIIGTAAGEEIHRKEVPVCLALLLCHVAGLQLFMDEALLDEAPADHLEDEISAFVGFLEHISADDFARFNERQG